jgi:hypothetical protein
MSLVKIQEKESGASEAIWTNIKSPADKEDWAWRLGSDATANKLAAVVNLGMRRVFCFIG